MKATKKTATDNEVKSIQELLSVPVVRQSFIDVMEYLESIVNERRKVKTLDSKAA